MFYFLYEVIPFVKKNHFKKVNAINWGIKCRNKHTQHVIFETINLLSVLQNNFIKCIIGITEENIK